MSLASQVTALAARAGAECQALWDALGAHAHNDKYVDFWSDQSVGGVKTFTTNVRIPVDGNAAAPVRSDDARLSDTRRPGNLPLFRGYSTVAQSVPSGTHTAINLGAEDVDNTNGHVLGQSRYTCSIAGWYEVSGVAMFTAGTATGASANVHIRKNGVELRGASTWIPARMYGGMNRVPCPNTLTYLAVNDYVELWCYQDGGGAAGTTETGVHGSTFNVKWIT